MRGVARPRIGVTTSRRRGSFMWWANRLALWRAGAKAVRLLPKGPGKGPQLDSLDRLDRFDGFVIGGGDDIVPTLYGGELDPAVRVDPARDALELEVLEQAAEARLPVLGICRGAQLINVARGGSLHQDLFAIYLEAPRERSVLPRRRVEILPDSRLQQILDCEICVVNVLHSQSIDRLGKGLKVVARDRYGIVQGIEAEEEPLLIGVQWHPEFLLFDRGQQGLYRCLVAAARAHARRAAPSAAGYFP